MVYSVEYLEFAAKPTRIGVWCRLSPLEQAQPGLAGPNAAIFSRPSHFAFRPLLSLRKIAPKRGVWPRAMPSTQPLRQAEPQTLYRR